MERQTGDSNYHLYTFNDSINLEYPCKHSQMGSLANTGSVEGLAGPSPAALMAVTRNRYSEPSMRPATTKDSPRPIGRIGSRVTRAQRLPVVSFRSSQ